MDFFNDIFQNIALLEFYFLNIIYLLLHIDFILSIFFQHSNILTRASHHWCLASNIVLVSLCFPEAASQSWRGAGPGDSELPWNKWEQAGTADGWAVAWLHAKCIWLADRCLHGNHQENNHALPALHQRLCSETTVSMGWFIQYYGLWYMMKNCTRNLILWNCWVIFLCMTLILNFTDIMQTWHSQNVNCLVEFFAWIWM